MAGLLKIGTRRELLRRAGGVGGAAFPAGMVARWTLDDTSAGYVDLVGGRTLTAVGTAPTTAAGVIGDAASFGGAGGLSTPDAADMRLAIGMAVEAWIYPTTTAGTRIIVGRDLNSAREYALVCDGNAVRMVTYNSAGSSVAASHTPGVLQNVWTHVVGTVSSEKRAHIYVNGVLQDTTLALTGTLASFAQLTTVGYRAFSGFPSYFTGRIDEPAIWQFGASGDPGAAFWLARYNAGAGVRP